MRRICVVSDLHIFSKRSLWQDHMREIRRAAAESEVFVLNGDIFDFNWTTLPTVEETAEEAVKWLHDLTHEFSSCDFHYVMGNHDCVREFLDVLPGLCDGTRNLCVHEDFFKLGDCVFLHGDVGRYEMTPEGLALYRAKWGKDKKRGLIWHAIHDVAYALNIHTAIYRRAFPMPRTADHILFYLKHLPPAVLDGTKHVYFGHTHIPIDDYEYQGLHFHNCGAPLKNVKFRMFRFESE